MSVISRIGWAGLPTATVCGGISRVTTEPAPITQPSSIVTGQQSNTVKLKLANTRSLARGIRSSTGGMVVDSALISLIEHSCNFAKEHGWTHCIYGLCVWGESENGSTANER